MKKVRTFQRAATAEEIALLGEMPSLPRRALNATAALSRAAVKVVKGEPLKVTGDVLETRRATCAACEWWRAEAYAGMGGCGHPRCGCSAPKLELTSEACPVRKW